MHVINSLKTGGAEKLLVDWVLYGKGMGVNMDVALLNGEDTPLLRRLRKGNVTLFLLAEGRYAETPDYLSDYEIRSLRSLRK